MGKVAKGIKCSVIGCDKEAERSLSSQRASLSSSLKLSLDSRQVYLCKDHYKIWKKETKEIREIERSRWE